MFNFFQRRLHLSLQILVILLLAELMLNATMVFVLVCKITPEILMNLVDQNVREVKNVQEIKHVSDLNVEIRVLEFADKMRNAM